MCLNLNNVRSFFSLKRKIAHGTVVINTDKYVQKGVFLEL